MSDTRPPPDSWRAHLRATLRAHHRGLIWTLEAIGFLIAGLVILIAGAAYRLDQGPLEVRFLTPPLVAWLDHQLAPLPVSVGDTSVSWVPGDFDLRLYADDVKVKDRAGDDVVSVPSMRLAIGFKALLLGQLQPTAITVESPSLRLQRGPAGNFYLRPGPAPAPAPERSLQPVIAVLTEWAARDRDSAGEEGALGRLYIHDGTIEIEDQHAARNWTVSRLSVDVDRVLLRYDVTGAADIDSGTDHAHIGVSVNYDSAAHQSRYRLAVSPIVPAHWAPLMPDALARTAELNLPMNATVAGAANLANGTLGPIAFTSEMQSGTIVDPVFDQGHYALRHGRIAGRLDLGGDRLDLDHIAVDLGGPTAEASVALTGLAHATPALPRTLALRLVVHNVPRQGMEGYWPPVPIPKTRAWVLDHVVAGRLKDMSLQGKWEIHPELPKPMVKKMLDGTFRFEGVTLDFLHGLAPANGLDATARLTIDRMDFDASAAKVLGITLRHGTASIDGLRLPDTPSIMTIALDLAGPARDGITFISAPRLHVADKLGITPDAVSGTFDGPIQIRFPLPKGGSTRAEDVVYHGAFSLHDVGVVKGALGRDITAGNVILNVDPSHVSITGNAAIAGVPAQFSWDDSFDKAAAVRTRLHLTAAVDDAGRQHLGIDPLPGALRGAVGVEADATVGRDHLTRAALRLDLTPATVALGDANWTKPAGAAARLAMTAVMADGHWHQIQGLDAHGPDLDAQGDIDFDSMGGVSRADFRHLEIGATDAAAHVAHGVDGWHVDLSGKSIDATGYVGKFDQHTTPADRDKAPPVKIGIAADRLILGPGKVMTAAAFQGQFEHDALQTGDLQARISSRGILTFHLDRPENGGHIAGATDDLGAAARILSLSDHVAGGSATLAGTCVRTDGERHFTARLEAKDYRLVHAPVLAKLLSLASFTSIASLVNGNGVPFRALSADLSLSDGLLKIDHGRAYGDAIGIVAAGQYDFSTRKIALDGTLVPAYFLNGILSDLPVVGGLLAGGSGEGLFGANFKVGGPVGAPSVTVNPLSLLAPGLLRDLFLFQAPKPSAGKGTPP